VIHSAWAVNFNLGVRSFEAQHIRGTHNLISLCLASHLPKPARFFFCSSVSSASGTPKPATIAETTINDLRHAQATGYGRSKLISEHITHNAAQATGMEARVLRIGQLSGDTKSAIWNETEAVALMIRSAITVGALPALSENISWLPVDDCAKVCVDLSMAPASGQELVYHVLNPRTFNWARDLLPTLQQCQKLRNFDVVSPAEWLKKLATSEQDPVKNPSVKLLDFWQKKYGGSIGGDAVFGVDDDPPSLAFETQRTIEHCPRLGQVQQPVEAGLIPRYVTEWAKEWTAELE
jgi:thioester reductase-like protein